MVTAKGTLDAAESVSDGSLDAAKWLAKNTGKVLAVIQQIRLQAGLSQYTSGNRVEMAVKVLLKDRPKTVKISASADDIKNNRVANMLVEAIKKRL